ncbi:hypothetical protein R3W88_016515 [Solanum pinnatisectum]|uniref:C2H2-type domain-containing protein n=1 Tax=Solanum pinnatisectum TaxID=50273 RepID=A0AAV9KXL5_9SOLN|nr:hypothetical protein R3W88_016515 [Solanum pinnatisectum]
MVVYANLIACRVCGKIFPHALPLLYHFDQVHRREAYMLAIQQNSYPVSRTTHFKLDNKQGHSQFSSRATRHAMIEESHSRGQVYIDKELHPIYITKLLIKKIDKPFIYENIEEVEDKNVDLELKL